MEERIKEVYEAAKEGSVVSLLSLLQRDELILERCRVTSLGDTPLHVAAMLGHVEFCQELLRRNPALAGELDSRRSTTLHLASAKGQVEIVRALLYVDPEMCHARDCDDYNPVHIAAIKGKVEVLKEMVRIRADAALARTDRGETILHLCVQHYQLEALKFLIQDLNDEHLLNAADDQGNTILHLAVADKQIKMVRHLIANTAIDVNAYNSKGLTALDILACCRRDAKYIDIADCLRQAEAQKSSEISSPQANLRPTLSTSKDQSMKKKNKKNKKETRRVDSSSPYWGPFSDQQSEVVYRKRESLMIVASLMATMAFQANINPPGGVWQEDDGKHVAGSSIMGDKYSKVHQEFVIVNTISFISSLSVILLLISGLPLKRSIVWWIFMATMWASVTAIAGTYVISLLVTSPSEDYELHINVAGFMTLGWLALVLLVVVVHLVRLIFITLRFLYVTTIRIVLWMRTRRSPSAPANSDSATV